MCLTRKADWWMWCRRVDVTSPFSSHSSCPRQKKKKKKRRLKGNWRESPSTRCAGPAKARKSAVKQLTEHAWQTTSCDIKGSMNAMFTDRPGLTTLSWKWRLSWMRKLPWILTCNSTDRYQLGCEHDSWSWYSTSPDLTLGIHATGGECARELKSIIKHPRVLLGLQKIMSLGELIMLYYVNLHLVTSIHVSAWHAEKPCYKNGMGSQTGRCECSTSTFEDSLPVDVLSLTCRSPGTWPSIDSRSKQPL